MPTRSTPLARSISPRVRWCWRQRRASSVQSRTIGLAGSPTLDCPGPIAARAESTWSCHPATMVHFRKAGSRSPNPRRTTCSGSPVRSWRTTTIRSRWPTPSGSSPRYIPTTGGLGSPISEFLAGKGRFGRISPPTPAVFHEASGKVMNTIPPSDFSYFEMLNEIVQQEPAGTLDPELMGPIAAIGIVKGKPFAPDARMKKILTEAVAQANATTRSLFMHPRDPSWFYYPGSAWFNPLFVSGYEFETPIPMITREGAKPFPPTGYRQMDARRWYFYGVTGITPAMAMRVPGIGSQYLFATLDADKQFFDGGKTYKVTLPKDIPEANFWSLTLYDNQTRSMLDTPQRFPRAGNQSYPSPATEPNADGSTTIHLGPTQPAGIARGNWIQTMPGKGWFAILRLYSPREPFFAKEWRPSEIELVR